MAALEDEFGDVIRKARLGLEMTMEDVAAAATVPLAELTAWETYQGGPDAAARERLANVLQLPVDRLAVAQAIGFVPAVPPDAVDGVRVARVVVASKEDGYEENCYLWGWDDGIAVIDPGFEPDKLLAAIGSTGKPVLGYLITHHHWDHLSALGALLARHPGPVWVHRLEAEPAREQGATDIQLLHGGETFRVGTHPVTTLHTPGHTAGGTTYRVGNLAAVGDVLFAGSVGRTFMGEGGYAILLDTVRNRLLALPENTVLCPGHGPMTTVGEERAHNPFYPVVE